MGYTTWFENALEIDGTMTREFVEYINRFSSTRRMKRDNEKIKAIYPNWKELCFNGKLGKDGEYLAIKSNRFGQEEDASIIDYNNPATTQPGLWCQWVIETDQDLNDSNVSEFTGRLQWDGREKFYNYTEWLVYMIDNFFEPEGYVLNGTISFQGEDDDDCGDIIVVDNEVSMIYAENEEVDLENFSDDDLIEELKSRGYVVEKTK